jgi:hypothetical protein
MTDLIQRKQRLIVQGAVYRAQMINSGKAVRRGADAGTMAAQAGRAAAATVFAIVRNKLHLKQDTSNKIMPVVLERISTLSSVSTRRMRKPVLYGAMILGAISALPRFLIGRKSNDGD